MYYRRFHGEEFPASRDLFSFAFTGMTNTGKETSAMGRNSRLLTTESSRGTSHVVWAHLRTVPTN